MVDECKTTHNASFRIFHKQKKRKEMKSQKTGKRYANHDLFGMTCTKTYVLDQIRLRSSHLHDSS